MDIYRNERNAIRRNLQKIHAEIAALRLKTDVAHIQELEVQREKIGEEVNTLRQRWVPRRQKFPLTNHNLTGFYGLATRTQRFSFQRLSSNKKNLRKKLLTRLSEREIIKKEADEQEKSRVDLSKAVFSAREESKKFTSQIDSIDSELRLLILSTSKQRDF